MHCSHVVSADHEVECTIAILLSEPIQEDICIHHRTCLLAQLDLICRYTHLMIFLVDILQQTKTLLHRHHQLLVLAVTARQQPDLVDKCQLLKLLDQLDMAEMRRVERTPK